MDLPEKATVQTLIDQLATEYPVAADLIRHSVIALNQDYAEERPIHPTGDEVALIPPVSGGEEKQPTPLLFITEEPLSADHLICEVSNHQPGLSSPSPGSCGSTPMDKEQWPWNMKLMPRWPVENGGDRGGDPAALA